MQNGNCKSGEQSLAMRYLDDDRELSRNLLAWRFEECILVTVVLYAHIDMTHDGRQANTTFVQVQQSDRRKMLGDVVHVHGVYPPLLPPAGRQAPPADLEAGTATSPEETGTFTGTHHA